MISLIAGIALQFVSQPHFEVEAFHELNEFVQINTHPNNLEGIEVAEQWLTKKFEEIGLKSLWVPEDKLFKARLRSENPKLRLLLVGHFDTVYLKSQWDSGLEVITPAESDPLRQLTELWRGPGVADAKGGVVMLLQLLRNLKQDAQLWSQLEIEIALGADEELGSKSKSTQRINEDLKKDAAYDLAMVFEPGFVDVEAGGIVSRASLKHYVSDQSPGGYDLRIRVNRVPSHVGVSKERGLGAGDGLAEALMNLRELRSETVSMKIVQGSLNDSSAPTGPNGVTAQSASARLSFRFHDKNFEDRLREQIDLLTKRMSTHGYELKIEKSELTYPPQPLLLPDALALIKEASHQSSLPIPSPRNSMGRGAEAVIAANKVLTIPSVGLPGMDYHATKLEIGFPTEMAGSLLRCANIIKILHSRKMAADAAVSGNPVQKP